jgi:serine/threonine protein kinase
VDLGEAYSHAASLWGLASVTEIARGGQKVVATADQSGQTVVLKVVDLPATTGQMDLERCRREVDLLRSVESAHVVSVLTDLHVVGDPAECAMWLEEYLDGQDLAAILGPRWTWAETRTFLAQAASGLAELHRSGYVHRDLSPRNLRLTAAGRWVVMDPGLAKHLNRTSITGVLDPGTWGFMSPEHLTVGVRLTPAADVHGLGTLAYSALCGKQPTPFLGDPADYRVRLMMGDPASIGSERPDLPAEAIAVVDRCLSRQPARRYLDADELLADLATAP